MFKTIIQANSLINQASIHSPGCLHLTYTDSQIMKLIQAKQDTKFMRDFEHLGI